MNIKKIKLWQVLVVLVILGSIPTAFVFSLERYTTSNEKFCMTCHDKKTQNCSNCHDDPSYKNRVDEIRNGYLQTGIDGIVNAGFFCSPISPQYRSFLTAFNLLNLKRFLFPLLAPSQNVSSQDGPQKKHSSTI